MKEKDCTNGNLVKIAGIYWNTRLHNENLAHTIFFALTGLIVGIWTLTSQFLPFPLGVLAFVFSIYLARLGSQVTSKLESSNKQIIATFNRMRRKLRIDDLNINGTSVIPDDWKKYNEEEMKPKKSRWWNVYEKAYLAMMLIGIVLLAWYLVEFLLQLFSNQLIPLRCVLYQVVLYSGLFNV